MQKKVLFSIVMYFVLIRYRQELAGMCVKLAHQAMCLKCYLLPFPTPSYNRNIRMAFCLFRIVIRVASLTVPMKTPVGRRVRWISCWLWAHTAAKAIFHKALGTLQRLQLKFSQNNHFFLNSFTLLAGADGLIEL
jgi:hypothetical protein